MVRQEGGIVMVVTFCGHRAVEEVETVRSWLREHLERLVADGADTFYLGGYGAFDRLAASVVWSLKIPYPHIRSILVLPYLGGKMPCGQYDSTVFPPLETVPKRFAIVHRNRWMIQQSDAVLAYVLYGWGGAAATLAYAEGKGKKIIRFSPQNRMP